MSPNLKDLLSKMIVADPSGRKSLRQIKDHAFFKQINWKDCENGKLVPPEVQLREIKKSVLPMQGFESDTDSYLSGEEEQKQIEYT